MVSAVDEGENESVGVVVGGSAKASSSIVLKRTGQRFGSVGEALSLSVEGDEVHLGPGVFAGPFVVPAGVSLIGRGAHRTVLRGTGVGAVVQVMGRYGLDGQSQIAGVRISEGEVGVDGADADVWVRNVVVHEMRTDGIVGGLGGRLWVTNSTSVGNGGSGVRGSSVATLVANAVVGKNQGAGILVVEGGEVAYNTAYSNAQGNYGSARGQGNVEVEARFADEGAKDYREASDSPTIDLGDPNRDYSLEPSPNGARVNLGAFGNTDQAAKSLTTVGQ
jgi:hypothetical protein